MQTLTHDYVIKWLEKHLLDFEQFTPYLFTSEWIHSFCKNKQDGKEFEVKWERNGQDLYVRMLDHMDIDGKWKWLGTIKTAEEVQV